MKKHLQLLNVLLIAGFLNASGQSNNNSQSYPDSTTPGKRINKNTTVPAQQKGNYPQNHHGTIQQHPERKTHTSRTRKRDSTTFGDSSMHHNNTRNKSGMGKDS